MEKIMQFLEMLKGWIMTGADYFKSVLTREYLIYIAAACAVLLILFIWGIFKGFPRFLVSIIPYAAGFLLVFEIGTVMLESEAVGAEIFGVVPYLFWKLWAVFAVISYLIFYRVICGCESRRKIPGLLFVSLFAALFIGAAIAGLNILFMGAGWHYITYVSLFVTFIMLFAERLWLS